MNTLREKTKTSVNNELKYHELIPLTDKSIIVDEKCSGCGICARVCPANNIVIAAGKPEFQHRCEMYFACDEWCPFDAVHHWSGPEGLNTITRK